MSPAKLHLSHSRAPNHSVETMGHLYTKPDCDVLMRWDIWRIFGLSFCTAQHSDTNKHYAGSDGNSGEINATSAFSSWESSYIEGQKGNWPDKILPRPFIQ